MKKIAIIIGNPRKKSFSQFIAKKCEEGALEAGNKVKVIDLSKIDFYPVRRGGYGEEALLEKDLIEAQKIMKWADKFVIIYPLWMGNVPAILKGFFERTFSKGFAYDISDKGWPTKLLKEKSAHVIVTMGMPGVFYKFWYGAIDFKILKKGLLGFCGINPIKLTVFGLVDKASDKRRDKFIEQVKKIGSKQ